MDYGVPPDAGIALDQPAEVRPSDQECGTAERLDDGVVVFCQSHIEGAVFAHVIRVTKPSFSVILPRTAMQKFLEEVIGPAA